MASFPRGMELHRLRIGPLSAALGNTLSPIPYCLSTRSSSIVVHQLLQTCIVGFTCSAQLALPTSGSFSFLGLFLPSTTLDHNASQL